MRAFSQWAGDSWRFERVTKLSDLERGRTILSQLHGQRWQRDAKPGAFSSPLFLQFHDEGLPLLFERNALDLCWLSVRDRPIAALYNVVWRNRVYHYQAGRAVDVPKRIRPGVVAHLEAIKRAIEEGREEYDFLGGPAPYKRKLAYARRSLVTLRIVRPGLTEAARRLIETGHALWREARRRHESASTRAEAQSTSEYAVSSETPRDR